MARNLSNEPKFPTSEIQGDILAGLPKNHEHLIFFHITDITRFKAFIKTLELTSMQECLATRAAIAAKKALKDETIIPTPGLNIAFTHAGLIKLGVQNMDGIADLKPFKDGMASRKATLADPDSSNWVSLKPDASRHGVFILTGASHAEVVDIISLRLALPADNGWRLLGEEVGQVRPDPVRGHEHFGYADGVSQPGVRGTIDDGSALTPQTGTDDEQGMQGQDLLWPGEFLFGYPGQDENKPITEPTDKIIAPPVPFMNNGAFMVLRRLAQLVPEFNASVKHASAGIGAAFDAASPDLLGAQMVGRWKSGAPIINAPTQDDPTKAQGTGLENAFEFDKDNDGLKCPYAAHVRKAYPRNDVPGVPHPSDTDRDTAESHTQTHRMMRRGIAFGPEVTEDEAMTNTSAADKARGLLFICYVTSIVDQFEFVQQQWVDNANFSQQGSGTDPIIGQPANTLRPFAGAAPFSLDKAKKPPINLKTFVHMQGGEYFFAPSIKELKAL
jgi:Dyp-type peroxidase family